MSDPRLNFAAFECYAMAHKCGGCMGDDIGPEDVKEEKLRRIREIIRNYAETNVQYLNDCVGKDEI